MDQEHIHKTLKKHSLRITACRTDVLALFLEKERALSSRDLEDTFSNYDRVTLFRTLNSFLENGLLHKIPSDSGAASFALCQEDECGSVDHNHDHLHFTCNTCGSVECIDSVRMPEISIPGYKIEETNFLVKGICKNCN